MPPGDVIPSKQGRVEAGICRKQFEQYMERRADAGCEQPDCYGRGVLVKMGEKAIRESNDHIGIQLLQENQKRMKNQPSIQNGPPKSLKTDSIGGPIVIIDGDGLGQPQVVESSATTTGRVSEQKSNDAGGNAADSSRAQDGEPTASAENEGIVKKPAVNAPNQKVLFEDPTDPDPDTSSGEEEEHREQLWGNRGTSRRLSVATTS